MNLDDGRTKAGEGRSIIQLFKALASDTLALLQQEIALAKAEIRQNIKSLVRAIGEMGVGGVILAVSLLVFIEFAIIGLGLLLGGMYWLSSLIVAVVLLLAGGGLVYLGIRKLGKMSVRPDATLDSLQATREWAGDEVGHFRARLSGSETPERLAAGSTGTAVATTTTGGAVALESRPAVHPSRIGKTGKPALSADKPLVKRVMHEFSDDDLTGQGAKVAFYMFTSLPPALLVTVALASIFGGGRLSDFLTSRIQQMLPGSAGDPNSAAGFVSEFIEQVVTTNAPGPLSIGLISGLWAASAVFVALTDSLNAAYDVTDDRSWIKRRALAVGVMLGFLALFILGSLALIAGPQIAAALELGGVANLAWSVLQWPLAFLLIVLAFFLVYRALPNRDQSGQAVTLMKGSAIAAALWLLATLAFRLYIANFGSYGETYGFVGAILVLLLWMYLTGIVILLGGEIASEMERTA